MGAILMTMFTTSSTSGSVQTSAGQAFGLANTTSSLTPLMAPTPMRHELPASVGPASPRSRRRVYDRQNPGGTSGTNAPGTAIQSAVQVALAGETEPMGENDMSMPVHEIQQRTGAQKTEQLI